MYCQVCRCIGFYPKCDFCGRVGPKPKREEIEGEDYIIIWDGSRKPLVKKSKTADIEEKENKKTYKEEMKINAQMWNNLKIFKMAGTGVAAIDEALKEEFGDWLDPNIPLINVEKYLKEL